MNVHEELAEIALANRDLAVRIDALAAHLAGETEDVYDPEDEPPVRPDVDGDRAQKDWGALMLWMRLLAVNVRQHRGATNEEVVEIAKAAGYRDGRGWNRWTGWKQRDDGRWVTAGALIHLRTYSERVGRALPADLAAAAERLRDSED